METMGISELAERAGVSLRTVRYYVSEGLLPPPGGAGQKSVYSGVHLARLEAIKRLKERYLPLAEIRRALDRMSATEMEELSAERQPPSNAALDYITSIMPPLTPRRSPPASAPSSSPEPAPQLASPSVWRRVVLAPGVELQYEVSGNRERDARITRLIGEATDLLRELPPAE